MKSAASLFFYVQLTLVDILRVCDTDTIIICSNCVVMGRSDPFNSGKCSQAYIASRQKDCSTSQGPMT